MPSRLLHNLPALLWILRSPIGVIAITTVVVFPTLFSGFLFDDHIHLLTLAGKGFGAHPFDLFIFGTGDSGRMAELIRGGPYPWYTLPELKVHFFRLLSSATMFLDYTLFGERPFFYHLHSLLWYTLLVWGVSLLFRRHLPGPVFALATLLYILDDGHLLPVAWWSNRNAIVAAAPAVFGLAAHLRWRENGWKPGLPLSLLGYGTGLLGGETALGILGYVVAYELVARPDRPAVRIRALAPGLSLALVYLVAYKWAGYGVYGSGVYLDPAAEWPRYLAAVPGRLLDLAGAQFFSLPVELAVFSSATGTALRVLAAAGLLTVALALRCLWPLLPDTERRAIAWLGLGALVSAFPAMATFPSGRLLTLPSIGACAVIAVIIFHGAVVLRQRAGFLLRGAAAVFAWLHVLLAPLVWLAYGAAVPAFTALSNDAFRTVEVDGARVPGQLVFTLFSTDPYTGFYPVVMRKRLGFPDGAGWQILSLAPHAHEITRIAENRFEVRVVGGELLATGFERLMRGPQYRFAPGDRVELGEYRVEILETGAWGPSRFALEFERSLEDPRYAFLAWRAGRLAAFDWPAVGESVVLSSSESYFAWSHFRKRLQVL